MSEFHRKKAHEFNGLLLFEMLFQLQTVRVFPITKQQEISDKVRELVYKMSQSESEALMLAQETDWSLFLSAVHVCFLHFKYLTSHPELKSIFFSKFVELSVNAQDRIKQVASEFPWLFPEE